MSILDYQHDTLSPRIWRSTGELRQGVQEFIFDSLKAFFEHEDITGWEEFVKRIYIGSSLATYFYTETSDLDVKVIVDVDSFRENNKRMESLFDDDILEYLIDAGRKSYWLTAMVPGTLHVLDFYFYSTTEAKEINLLKYDSLYDVIENKWIKEPKKLIGGLSPIAVLNFAKEKAQPYLDSLTLNIAKTKRDTIDLMVLIDYLKTLDGDDLSSYAMAVVESLDVVNNDIEELIEDRDIIRNLRHTTFEKKELRSELEKIMGSINYSDENLIFKVLQRYGYMRILSEIKELFRDKHISLEEIPELAEILNIRE